MPVGTTLTSDELRESFASFASNLRSSLSGLDEEIAELEEQLAEKRALRKRAVNAIRLDDPSFELDAKPGPKPKHSQNGKPISDEKLKQLREWLEARRDEIANGGITASEVARRDDFGSIMSTATVSAGMRVLHDRGVLRLDHLGTGGGKWYVLA